MIKIYLSDRPARAAGGAGVSQVGVVLAAVGEGRLAQHEAGGADAADELFVVLCVWVGGWMGVGYGHPKCTYFSPI